jgi:hypothetical protein
MFSQRHRDELYLENKYDLIDNKKIKHRIKKRRKGKKGSNRKLTEAE